MQTRIKATKIELTEAIREYVDKKMTMLEKYLGSYNVINCDVEVGMTTSKHNKGQIYKAEINLQVPGELIRIEKEAEDLYKAIDKAKDHMAQAIVKYKDKRK